MKKLKNIKIYKLHAKKYFIYMCVKFYFCVSECFRLLEIWKSQLGRLCEFRETSNRNSKTFISIYFRIHGILLTDQILYLTLTFLWWVQLF